MWGFGFVTLLQRENSEWMQKTCMDQAFSSFFLSLSCFLLWGLLGVTSAEDSPPIPVLVSLALFSELLLFGDWSADMVSTVAS